MDCFDDLGDKFGRRSRSSSQVKVKTKSKVNKKKKKKTRMGRIIPFSTCLRLNRSKKRKGSDEPLAGVPSTAAIGQQESKIPDERREGTESGTIQSESTLPAIDHSTEKRVEPGEFSRPSIHVDAEIHGEARLAMEEEEEGIDDDGTEYADDDDGVGDESREGCGMRALVMLKSSSIRSNRGRRRSFETSSRFMNPRDSLTAEGDIILGCGTAAHAMSSTAITAGDLPGQTSGTSFLISSGDGQQQNEMGSSNLYYNTLSRAAAVTSANAFSSTALSNISSRRRSSSSIRFADDTDTGTDILMITEEDLADILTDPIYGDSLCGASSSRATHRLSSPYCEEVAYFGSVTPVPPMTSTTASVTLGTSTTITSAPMVSGGVSALPYSSPTSVTTTATSRLPSSLSAVPRYSDSSSPSSTHHQFKLASFSSSLSGQPHQQSSNSGRHHSLIASSVNNRLHLLHGIHGMSLGGTGSMHIPSSQSLRSGTSPSSSSPEPDSEENSSRGIKKKTRSTHTSKMLLTLRRKKSLQRNVYAIDPLALLDFSFGNEILNRFLNNSASWKFSSFTLDTMTGGHALSNLLFHLFNFYDLINHFKLDIVCLWKCFRLFEQGYHDTNPYHNSVHAADVTQAMHCFIQEKSIGPYLTKMETMCAILAAVAHDLDHPGVNQHFLIATNSHLASLYNNLSVLESHHWRFAISCLKESHVFDHLSPVEWNTIRHLLRSLILATDITQQASYLAQFRIVMSSLRERRRSSNKTDYELFQEEDIELEQELENVSIRDTRDEKGEPSTSRQLVSKPSSSSVTASTKVFNMKLPESRLFILTIALKCADLGNPCRPWDLSKRWSEQICAEFYRQGDFERQLDLPVTPICNRYEASMAKIQTDFFRNVVIPLFELWDQFLSSDLSRQLMANLTFNNDQWDFFLKKKIIDRRHSASGDEDRTTSTATTNTTTTTTNTSSSGDDSKKDDKKKGGDRRGSGGGGGGGEGGAHGSNPRHGGGNETTGDESDPDGDDGKSIGNKKLGETGRMKERMHRQRRRLFQQDRHQRLVLLSKSLDDLTLEMRRPSTESGLTLVQAKEQLRRPMNGSCIRRSAFSRSLHQQHNHQQHQLQQQHILMSHNRHQRRHQSSQLQPKPFMAHSSISEDVMGSSKVPSTIGQVLMQRKRSAPGEPCPTPTLSSNSSSFIMSSSCDSSSSGGDRSCSSCSSRRKSSSGSVSSCSEDHRRGSGLLFSTAHHGHPLSCDLVKEGPSEDPDCDLPNDDVNDDDIMSRMIHPLSTHPIFIEKLRYAGGRRGSAPGCIGIYAAASCELAAAAAAFVFIQGTINSTIRRSSAPMDQHNQMNAPPSSATLGDQAAIVDHNV